MQKHEAAALVMYLQRAHGIVPTTGQEYEAVRGATQVIELIANGIVSIDIKPVTSSPAPAAAAATPPRQPRRKRATT